MDDLENKINSLLSSPEQMEKIMSMAKSLSGSLGGESAQTAEPVQEAAPPPALPELPDPRMMKLITRLFGQYSAGANNEKTALLTSIGPYLKDERRQNLQKAMEIARLARLARTALSEFSGGESDL